MMKKLIIIVALFCCQLNASQRHSFQGFSGELQQRKFYDCQEVLDRVCAMLSDPNAEWDPDFTKCSRRSILRSYMNRWKVIAASSPIKAPWSIKFDVAVESARNGLRPYFIKEGTASGTLTQSYRAKTGSDSNWDSKERCLIESRSYVIEQYSNLCLTELPKESLTLLSKGLIAATVVGIGALAHYAYTHNRLTRSVSVDVLEQEQKDRAQLPENKHSQIAG